VAVATMILIIIIIIIITHEEHLLLATVDHLVHTCTRRWWAH